MRCGHALFGEEVFFRMKLLLDHSIGHIPFASLEGDKRPDKIHQNPETLNILCAKQENNV